ncbi:hypothetical protein A33Q_4628 [Indibacter alkaliphilus LW1]|uniref:Uncharacterized protein n=1 Tax=Indibacter alkaliphilus (strain CCUG 57479 / KCTC 22604 / LW1) TaxID=1189612 RepID=S2D3I5_INDAL|nr:hypothetical protein A33Q_4628 [Indibacter alkaliphilus LW1]
MVSIPNIFAVFPQIKKHVMDTVLNNFFIGGYTHPVTE